MKISGLDYNTQREKLILPEYGREVQQMVDHCVSLPDRAERQRCAQSIVAIMERMMPPAYDAESHRHKLWDHLAIMSDFKLDIDYPYDVSQAQHITERPKPMPYPMKRIPVRHYGSMMFEIFEMLKTMPAGHEREELTRLAANQMKRDLMQWGHGSVDSEKVASDLAQFTDGRVQIDPDTFKFDKIDMRPNEKKRRRK